MRQARADDDERRPRLRQLVARRAQRRDVVGRRSCISSMRMRDAALHVRRPASATSVNSSTRSISMSPESARPERTATSMPGCQRSRSFAPSGDERSANALRMPSTSSTRSGSGWRTARSRIARCSAAESGRRRSASGRASILPAPQPARTAIERSSPSSTVLPTPRSPVSTRLRSGRPRATRSSTISNASSSRSRPASSGGRCPAPGAKGLRTGSTIGPYRGILRRTVEAASERDGVSSIGGYLRFSDEH